MNGPLDLQPAPLAAQELQDSLAPFGLSKTLPAAAYTSSAVFEWELNNFFSRTWLCLGRVDALLAPGEARALRAGSQRLLLTRSQDGSYSVFWNVCRHRGHELLPEGSVQTLRQIRCPYHSWTYRLDGTLRTAPQYQGVDGFDPNDYPLRAVPHQTWNGWLFVRGHEHGVDLPTQLGNLDEVLSPWQIEHLGTGASHEYEAHSNWKLIVENYHECYHCTTIHPALCKVTPPDSGHNVVPTGWWTGGTMELRDHARTMSFDGASPTGPFDYLPPDARRQVWYLGLFPNLLVSAHPDYVMAHVLTPLAPDRTHIRCEWLFDRTTMARGGFDPSFATDFWDQTNKEDWAATEGVQRGMASGGYLPGPLNPAEANVYMFIRMVAQGYRDGNVQAPDLPATAAFQSAFIR